MSNLVNSMSDLVSSMGDLSKMKIILADTSSQVESVALMQGRQLLGEKQILRTKGHAPGLLLDIEQLLSENQMKIQEIDAFVCGVGPGSFTGIRVGMTSLKTLAYALKKPIYAVSTILGLLRNMPFSRTLGILDARRGEVFIQGFGIETPICTTIEALIPKIHTETQVLLGDGALKYEEILLTHHPHLLIPKNPILHLPRASMLYEDMGQPVDPKTLEPIYLRASDAEINYPNGYPSEARLFDLLKGN
jgi:tRNA threonylcarbamoyladenosine biosynthesis protein TsaB